MIKNKSSMNIKVFWNKSSNIEKLIYCVYILAYVIAASTHTRDLLIGGFLPYDGYPLWANIFWTSLTVADPVAIIILLLSLRKGVITYAVIIFSDVIINVYFTLSIAGWPGVLNIFLLSQVSFLLFLMFTWKRLYRITVRFSV